MKISIAMATYNGEKYLHEQLDSFLAQTRQPDELVVCDDGSSDATVEILRQFAADAPFEVRIHVNERNLGYSDNFLKAAKLCEGDWIAFCDQDDVWLPNKLKSAADAIEQGPGLTMVLQNAELCDGRLNRHGRVFPNKIRPGFYGPNSQYGFWVWQGFLQTISSKLFKNIDCSSRPLNYLPVDPVQSHDKWTCVIANAIGGIVVLGEPVALYRRHEAAITGNHSPYSLKNQIYIAKSVGWEDYLLYAKSAKSHERYFLEIAGRTPVAGWGDKLEASAKAFSRFSYLQYKRSSLYKSSRFLSRLSNYLKIWRYGGYVGPKFVAMGGRSALKDAFQVVTGRKVRD
ncbi:glycosyltransferase family 2 protein [Alloalcanivorax marinus]|uniref:glycosyltransferase family 2 protein n=1 Tax=Alloalcanivorax marinus TaxID=1177169 RepID=UPI0021CDF9AE|nr:glycosyltransferase family 2 protein [Alloalcanivorax marinus]MCU5788092.1 family 2 glycosyl transferase [Alloalcanivorax marinus]